MSITPAHSFRTVVPRERSPFHLSYSTKGFLMGSCFSTAIGNRLSRDQFQILSSPFGIVYDVTAMADQLDILLSERMFTPDDLIHDGELYHSFLHHGSFSGSHSRDVLARMNTALEHARHFLQTADWLNLTWATTRSFTHLPSGRRTANNHQLPGTAFASTYTPLDDLIPRYGDLLHTLRQRYPQLRVTLTISPVRYLQDGFVANTRSKATLHLLAAALENQGAWTFPSYEILHDELRDYRFYEPDLIHPTALATDLIYAHFLDNTLGEEDHTLYDRIQKVRQILNHRVRYPDTPTGIRFQQKRQEAVQSLRQDFPQYPWLFHDVTGEDEQSSGH